jgi:micrococcal nuclease
MMKTIGIILFLTSFSIHAAVISASVVGVSDDDTITVLSPDKQHTKIRLDSIDAPEKNQNFGQASKKYLSNLVFKKDITYEAHKIDKYGRTVASVWTGSPCKP